VPGEAPVLLLTGATGLVGNLLLRQFITNRPDRRVVLLLRKETAALPQHPAIRTVIGDIRQCELGLPPNAATHLSRTVSELVHCAAETRFDLPLAEAYAANVAGTRNVLGFARRCLRLEKIAHVSTAFAAGRTIGSIPEHRLSRPDFFSNTYQQSKFEAEQVAEEFARDLPIAIFRLSSIIGDSGSGAVRQFNYVHQLLRLFPRNILPCIPADPSAPVDLIASDWVAAAFTHIFDTAFRPRVYHLCAGMLNSMSVREMIQATAELFGVHPKAQRWLPISVPRMVSLTEYEEFVRQTRQSGDRLLSELLRVLDLFLPHLGMFQNFENSHTMKILAAGGIPFPSSRDVYEKVVAYCLDTNWGNRGSPA